MIPSFPSISVPYTMIFVFDIFRLSTMMTIIMK